MLSEDLLSAVAFDSLGPMISTDHYASRVEHIDGVVSDAIYQQLQLSLGLRTLLRTGQENSRPNILILSGIPNHHVCLHE